MSHSSPCPLRSGQWARCMSVTLLGLAALLAATGCGSNPGSATSTVTPSPQAPSALYVFTGGASSNGLPGGAVYALNLADGRTLWSSQFAGALVGEALSGGGLYVGVRVNAGRTTPPHGLLEALNPNTGAPLWQMSQSSGVMEPLAAASDAVFVDTFPMTSGSSAPSSTIEALNASNGALLWRSTHKDSFSPSATASDRALFLVASSTGKTATSVPPAYSLLALNTNNGKALWRFPLQSPPSAPELSGGALYLSEQYGQQAGQGSTPTSLILAVRTSDGKMIWRVSPVAARAIGGLVVSDGAVCYSYDAVNGPGSGVVALNATDGSLMWQLSSSTSAAAPLTSGDGVLYSEDASASGPLLTRTMRAYAISTGQALFTQSFPSLPVQLAPGAIGQSPQVFGGDIYFVAPVRPARTGAPAAGPQSLSVAFALNASDGGLKWDRTLDGVAITALMSS